MSNGTGILPRRTIRMRLLIWALAFVCLPSLGTAQAQVSREQQREINEIRDVIRRAGNLYTRREFDESSVAIREAQERVTALAENANPAVMRRLEPVLESLERAHTLLQLEGIELPPLVVGNAAGGGMGPSFVEEVAPILLAKCGRCHVTNARGDVSLANYTSILRGSPEAGRLIEPRDGPGSKLLQVIESGDMPRGGLEITDPEKATLLAWVQAGATFDGEDPDAGLAALVPGAEPDPTPAPEVMPATGEETISFALEVAPVLVNQCGGCHGSGQQVRGGLNLMTFRGLLRGGDGGPPIRPGNSSESLLVQKLRGTGPGQRMPLQRPPLSDEVIDRIATWIDESARFDGADANQDLTQVVALAEAAKASHEELSDRRLELAAQNWRLGFPGINAATVESENFHVMGNLGTGALEEVAREAEGLIPQVARIFRTTADEPLIKGRITLFLLTRRYDYSEFGTMVERRELPSDWRGHWRYSVLDAYAAVMLPPGGVDEAEALLSQQIGSLYVASRGEVPYWLAEGAGRVVASRVDPQSPLVIAWNSRERAVLSGMRSPDDFLDGLPTLEDTGVASYSYVKFLMSDSRRFQVLLGQLEAGQPFDETFRQVYGGTPQELAPVWIQRVARSLR